MIIKDSIELSHAIALLNPMTNRWLIKPLDFKDLRGTCYVQTKAEAKHAVKELNTYLIVNS